MPRCSTPAVTGQMPVKGNGSPEKPGRPSKTRGRTSRRHAQHAGNPEKVGASGGVKGGLAGSGSAAGTRSPVVWAAVILVALIAGLTTLWWATGGLGVGGPASTPVPRVTVTAQPDGTASITARDDPNDTLSQRDGDASVIVRPNVDLSQHSVDDPQSPWVVINKTRPVDPQSWVPPELESVGGAELVPQAAEALREMLAAAKEADAPLRVATGYRAYGFQESIYRDYANKWGRDRADRFSARPGFSEHQTGWAVDVFHSESCRLQVCFADEAAGQWLAAHAHEYGFVVRYPQGAEAITGYTFEPWHLRYVGSELATAMHEHNIATLEQVFELPAAPDYS